MYALGQKITQPRGRRGERPDLYAGKIASNPIATRVNGRNTLVADILTAETTLAGEQRLVHRLAQDLQFVFPFRQDGSEWVEILDGTPSEPKSVQTALVEQAKAAMAYLLSRPESVATMDLADVEA